MSLQGKPLVLRPEETIVLQGLADGHHQREIEARWDWPERKAAKLLIRARRRNRAQTIPHLLAWAMRAGEVR